MFVTKFHFKMHFVFVSLVFDILSDSTLGRSSKTDTLVLSLFPFCLLLVTLALFSLSREKKKYQTWKGQKTVFFFLLLLLETWVIQILKSINFNETIVFSYSEQWIRWTRQKDESSSDSKWYFHLSINFIVFVSVTWFMLMKNKNAS